MNLSNEKKYSILIVDDDEDLLWLLQQRLLVEGYEPLLSPNAVNVMDIITHKHPDLVLLDIHMQGINGGDICKKIKLAPTLAGVPVILLSSNDNIETVSKMCGADGFMRKPFNLAHFRNVMDRFFH